MKILLTGATGYIGNSLLAKLLDEGHEVVALVRQAKKLDGFSDKNLSVVEGNLLTGALPPLPADIDVAYYLVHSMSDSHSAFIEMEQKCAANFVVALEKTAARQIIYLSGLTNEDHLSEHLESRRNVQEILSSGKIPCTTLHAGIIIGEGSGSFEMMCDLVEKLPFMVAPRWVKKRCQPIWIGDVLYYLDGVMDNKQCFGRSFDIGGPDRLSYKEMLLELAKARKLKRYILTVPVLTPRLSSYWLYFVTSTNFSLARSLVSSLQNDALCKDNSIDTLLPHRNLSYRESLGTVFSANVTHPPLYRAFKERIEIPITGSIENIKKKIWTIGGKNGWYYMNWAWKLRGFIDKVFGGEGLRADLPRGKELKAGDKLDFWRVVEADKESGHLLLFAEMKVPGEAWLEFSIKDSKLFQTATFRPRGVLGRLYWYTLLPIHHLIFKGMAKAIAQ